MSAAVAAMCRAYAAHAGLPQPEDGFRAEAARRLRHWPAWARLGAGAAAWTLRWLGPALRLGRLSRFDALEAEEKEALLQGLQCATSPFVRGPFLLAKTAVLGACYGGEPARGR